MRKRGQTTPLDYEPGLPIHLAPLADAWAFLDAGRGELTPISIQEMAAWLDEMGVEDRETRMAACRLWRTIDRKRIEHLAEMRTQINAANAST